MRFYDPIPKSSELERKLLSRSVIWRRLSLHLLRVVLIGLTVSKDFGATRSWDGGGANTLWSTSGNWTTAPGAGDTVSFGTGFGSGTTINLSGARTANALIISTTTSFVMTNGSLSLGNGDITRNSGSSGDQILAIGITMAGAGAWAIDGGGTLTVSGAVGESGGTRTLQKSTAGTLILTGTNTFTGGASITGGKLIVGANAALGSSAAGTTVSSGASLGFQGGINYSTAEAVTINGVGSGSLGAIYNVSGNNTFAGTVAMASASSIGSSSGTLTLGGVVSGSFSLTKVGAGTVALSNTGNSFTGVINLNAGTLSVGADTHLGNSANDIVFGGGTLNVSANVALGSSRYLSSTNAAANIDVNSGATLTLGTASQLKGGNSLIKSGSGTLLITADNSSLFTGSTIINGGTVSISTENQLGATANDVTLNGGTLFVTGTGFTANSGKTFTVGSSGGTLSVDTGTLTLGAAGQLVGTTGSTFTKTGAGVLVLSGNNSASFTSGTIAINGGAILIAAENNLGALGNDVTMNGGYLATTTGFTASAGKVFTFGTSGGGLSIAAGQTVTLGTAGQVAGTAGIVGNIGPGTLVVSGDNSSSLTGNSLWYLMAGTLQIGAENNLGAAGNDVTFAGGTLNVTGGFTANAGKVFGFTTGGGTLDINSGQTLTLATAGQLSGTTTMTKAGSGTLVISGDNSSGFSGNTVVSGGTVQISAENNLGAAASDITLNSGTLAVTSGFTANAGKVLTLGSGGGALDISSGQTLTFASASQLTGTGNLTKGGAGTLTLGGSSSYSGNLVINSGEIRVQGSQSAVDSFITTSRLNNLSGAGGILTLAYNDATPKDRIIAGGPTLPSNIKLGFDAVNTPLHSYGLGASANDMSNFAGLVVKGGQVYIQYDQNFTGPGSSSTLDMTGGEFQLFGGSGPATVTFHGKVTLTGGTIDGGGLGGAKGTLATTGDLEVGSGLTITGTPNFTMMPDAGATTHLYGSGSASTLYNFVKAGDGTVQVDTTLGVASLLDVQKGTLLLGADNRITDSSPLRLAANTVFATGGYDETLGSLTLAGSSVIDLGSGDSLVHFSDSSAISWSSALVVSNWTGNLLGNGSGSDQIYFGSTATGLTSNQVAQIWFVNPYGFAPGYYGAEITTSGEVRPRPVPEPATIAGMLLLAGVIGYRERRTLEKWLKRFRARVTA